MKHTKGIVNAVGARLPLLNNLSGYNRHTLAKDLLAAVIVTVLLIPQSLGYALVAGVPPQVGIFASIAPLVIYALLGTSRTLSVGPVAVISLMSASSLAPLNLVGSDYIAAAGALALLSGAMLVGLSALRLGGLASFLSHTVIAGFITASAIVIALGQFKHILGIPLSGDSLTALALSGVNHLDAFHPQTALMGLTALGLFIGIKFGLKTVSSHIRHSNTNAIGLLQRLSPIAVIVVFTFMTYVFDWQQSGISITGFIPSSAPTLTVSFPELATLKALFLPALMIALIGYIESISVGKTLAAKRRQVINNNQELLALGSANIASGLTGGMAVTGGFSRSIVNFDAGAQTQMASIFAAFGILLAALFLTPALYYLPKPVLAATIIMAVTTLVDFSILKKTWRFSKKDFYAASATMGLTLIAGVEIGVASGVLISIALQLHFHAHPHIAEVGQLEMRPIYRNKDRHDVTCHPSILSLRIDESIFFANAEEICDHIKKRVYQHDAIAHVIIQSNAINDIDYSAIETLESLNHSLYDQGVKLHFSELKGPVMDQLKRTGFLEALSGDVFFTHHEAVNTLSNA